MKRCIFGPGVLKAIKAMPPDVRAAFGFALHVAETGGKAMTAKPLRGMGSGVLEVVEDHDGNTFRAVYTVRFPSGVYVLHAFQKKSKSGIETSKHDIAVIKERLKWAEMMDQTLTT